MLAIPFPAFDPVVVDLGPVQIRWYALAYLAGFLIGDGLVAGVRVLQAAKRMKRPLSELRTLRARCPQLLVNVRMAERRPLDDWPAFQQARAEQESRLGDQVRFVIRYSGTEPLLRIMAEGHDAALVEGAVEALAAVARAELG